MLKVSVVPSHLGHLQIYILFMVYPSYIWQSAASYTIYIYIILVEYHILLFL